MIITLSGSPISKKRHRHFSRGSFVSTYDPQTKETGNTKREMISQAGHNPVKNSVLVKIIFYIEAPKSHSEPKRNTLMWGLSKTKKPDLDNLAKYYLDAGNGVLWEDDSQITSLELNKCYSNNPRTVIMVDEQMDSLDDQAKDILSLVSPEKFQNIIYLLSLYRQCVQEGEKCPRGNPAFDRSFWASRAAVLLSEIAETCGTQLAAIKKKHPGYWKKHQKTPFGERKMPC